MPILYQPRYLEPNVPITPDTNTKITYDADGLVTAGADATTADIDPSTDRNYVTDAEAIVIGDTSGVNTGDQDLSGLGPAPDSGYFQFNNAGAFGAVETATGAYAFFDGTNIEIAAPLINEPVITPNFVGGVRIFNPLGFDLLGFQRTDLNNSTSVSIIPNGTVANYPAILSFFSTDWDADPSNYSVLQFLSKGTADTYHSLGSAKGGTGTVWPINIEALNSLGAIAQLVIGTDGGVSIGTGTAAGSTNLLVAGTVTGSNLSGTNTGDQTLVGLGGVPTSRSLTIGPTTADLSSDRSFITNVTNDAQTKAAIVPNTAPSAGQLLAGNAGGTAYAPVTLSGSGATASLSSAGVLTLSAIANATLSNSAITIAGTSTALGGSITQDTITGLGTTGLVKRTGANTLAIATIGTDYITSPYLFCDSPCSTIAINVLTGAPATIVTKTITYAAGDQVVFRIRGSIINNSGGTRTYAIRVSLGTLTADLTFGATVAASATNRVPVEIEATFAIKANNVAWMHATFRGSTAAALGTSGAEILLIHQSVVQHTTNDITGSQAGTIAMFSSANNATQSFELNSWLIEKAATNP